MREASAVLSMVRSMRLDWCLSASISRTCQKMMNAMKIRLIAASHRTCVHPNSFHAPTVPPSSVRAGFWLTSSIGMANAPVKSPTIHNQETMRTWCAVWGPSGANASTDSKSPIHG